MTKAAKDIVTDLGSGPKTARELSQRLNGISYANIRQNLERMARAGIVTKLQRGLYGLTSGEAPEANCDAARVVSEGGADCDSRTGDTADRSALPSKLRPTPYHWEQIECAITAAWTDFEAMNYPFDPLAWT